MPKRLSGSSFSETKKAACCEPGWPPNLKRSPALLDQRIDETAAGEDRGRVEIVRSPFVTAGLGREAGDLAVLEQQQAVAFGNDDLRPIGDDVRRALGIRAASGIGTLRHRGEQRGRRRQAARHGVEVHPLVGERTADRTCHRLNKTHDISPRFVAG